MGTLINPTDGPEAADPGRTSRHHVPGFIVFGAMRAGTTTLYHHLSNHPDVGMSRMKETDFFIPKMNYPLGLDWYKSQFPPGFAIHGEVSPNYGSCHLWRGVPERIHATLPDVRLIFIARDPVDRFVSHYLHVWHVGHARVEPKDLLSSQNGQNMLDASRYAKQVNAYLRHFPRDRLLLLDFDQLRSDPQAVMDQVAVFLGVDRHPVSDVATRNDAASTARMPGFIQRAWRSRGLRRFDRFISRDMRNTARNILSVGPRRPDPEIGPDLRCQVAEALAEDAKEFRALSGMAFADWKL